MFVEDESFSIHLRRNSNCNEANAQTLLTTKCNKNFAQLECLNEDNGAHGNTSEKKQPSCCKEISMSIDHHRQDKIQRTAEKPHKCEKYLKSFNQNVDLQNHFKIHKGDGLFQKQQVHLKTHTADKPHKCEHCDKCFNRKDVLQRHLLIHTRERQYHCEYCKKTFSRSDDLSRHIRTHTGDKPFKCVQCGKGFNQSGDMNRHIRMHTGVKPFRCELCGKSFCRKYIFSSHMKKHIKDKQ